MGQSMGKDTGTTILRRSLLGTIYSSVSMIPGNLGTQLFFEPETIFLQKWAPKN